LVSITFFFVVIKPKAFVKTFLTLSVIVAIIYLTIPALNEVINNYMRWETLSDTEVYWKMGLDIIKDFPIFGIGPDLFDRYFYYYAPSTTISFFQSEIIQVGKPHPHNFFLYFTAENGILGLLTSIAFFVLFFYIAFKAIQLTKNSSREYYIFSIAITGIGFGEISRSFIEISGHLTYGLLSADLPFWLVFVILIYIKQKFSRPFINNLQ
ncbi:MAG: O-antigen ligase family protein, partial [Clostridiaceae bacterium]|nr:O-antigen ligase family protein [Clostridiaceae bacterium]